MPTKRQVIQAKCFDKKGNLLSQAFNDYNRSHPLMKHFAEMAGQPERVYLHAEVSALLRSRGKKVHRIVVERFNSQGEPMLAKPCPCCSKAIKAFGVQVVQYTTSDLNKPYEKENF